MVSRSASKDITQRQRRYASKSKTGCKTCRQRRIKCGEERPQCRRCLMSGRLCDGYQDRFRLADSNDASPNNNEVILSWSRPPSHSPDADSVEQEAIYHFRESVLGCACSTWDVSVWRRLVLPMSVKEPIIRHALAALSGLMQSERDSFGLRQYGLAMQDLQAQLASSSTPDRAVILVACVVFASIEFLLNGREQAVFHLNGGLSIIEDSRRSTGIYYGVSAGTNDLARLEQLFHRLDNQLSLYSSTRVRLVQATSGACVPCLPAQHQLKTIEKAGELHHLQISAMRELVMEANVQRFSLSGSSIADRVELEAQQTRQLVSLHRWDSAMQVLVPSLTHAPDMRLAKQLQISYACCRMMVLHALDPGIELSYDEDIPTFQQILALAAEIQACGSDHACWSGRRFSLDMGIIAPLYFTVLKCREPTLRRRALALLRSSRSHEGAWDSVRMAALGEVIVNVEEQGLESLESAAGIPECRRLWRAYFDTDFPGVLFCQRRLWEQDGRWSLSTVQVA